MGVVPGQGGGGPGGYQVHPQAMDAVAGQLSQVAADLQQAESSYNAPVCYAGSAFGEFGMDQAWEKFDTDWGAEIRVTQRAVAELNQNLTSTTANYRAAEATVAGSLTAIGASR
ncbi:type VII secretion target [Kitasatospora sp. GAS1066B]|uniref:type VII secretion target n=1 Tax=Kitasatospora sp. GAS1066B TaxID=3156271 RepID=UPI0035180204